MCTACITSTVNASATVTTSPWDVAAGHVIIEGFTITEPTFALGNSRIYIHAGTSGVQILDNTITHTWAEQGVAKPPAGARTLALFGVDIAACLWKNSLVHYVRTTTAEFYCQRLVHFRAVDLPLGTDGSLRYRETTTDRELPLMKTIIEIFSCVLIFVVSACAANYTVKPDGSGNYTTIQACATAMASGDTCTVYAGTYKENVTVPAGGAGLYKTITANGSDVVSVNSVTLGSHTKLVGNCTRGAAAGSCGFTFDHSSSPGGTCLALNGGATDVFIRANTLLACGRLNPVSGNTYYYIQGNTFAYAGCASPNLNHTCGQWIADWGDHSLVENNDFSHYQLGANIQGNFHIWRNNTFHDQFESEAGSNYHSDAIYMEPNFSTGNIVLEGNIERNAVGPNAKGILTQNDACSGSCTWGNVIERFNVFSRLGSAAIANDKSWPNVKLYNTTFVDEGQEASLTNGGDDMLSSGSGMAVLNSIWFSSKNFSDWNPYACSGCANYGHNLYLCTGTCTSVWGHYYGSGPFLNDPGNKNQNPLFVNYVGPGNSSNDYHLQSSSPAIGAGTNLTTVASGDSGSGTSLVVADATYFQDGYGLSNPYSTVNGDCIAVGTASNRVCVTTVNYATHTLTLASPISRSDGQAVYLYKKSDGVQVLTGSAPDMGAYPYGSGGGGSAPTPPSGLTAVVN